MRLIVLRWPFKDTKLFEDCEASFLSVRRSHELKFSARVTVQSSIKEGGKAFTTGDKFRETTMSSPPPPPLTLCGFVMTGGRRCISLAQAFFSRFHRLSSLLFCGYYFLVSYVK